MQHLTEVLVEGRIELSAGRALELGAVPCAASGCAQVTA